MCLAQAETCLEELGPLDSFKKVVATTLLFYNVAGLMRLRPVSILPELVENLMAYQNADLLVRVLTRDAVLGELHQNGLGRHW